MVLSIKCGCDNNISKYSNGKNGRCSNWWLWPIVLSDSREILNFWRTQVLFVGPLIPLFWTSGDICPGFQRLGGYLTCMLLHLCTTYSFRFTSGVAPADLLAASIVAEPFHLYTCIPALVRLQSTACNKTDVFLTVLRWIGYARFYFVEI